ncbi:Hypothetical predicted protein [Mytilus galloprovincialis]|uniref:TIR domain-containing protein n=1 Tax=Mytilus galloprovincialis TaxID=29158 RepID=A0A8B6ER26_MYTGA|nr:Hypothetical predicted protein [Mytilus galloprovincialis]
MSKPTITVCPGLYRLNLNLMHIGDAREIEKRREILEDAKVKEHEIVKQAITLMDNLIDNRLSRRSCLKTSIQKLKHSLAINPKHLNTLADLAEMHRKIHLDAEANKYDEDIETILTSNTFDDSKEIANCLLEQGYAYMFEDFDNYEKEARFSLNDASKQLIVELSNARGERKTRLQCAAQYAYNAQCLLNPKFEQLLNEHLLEKRRNGVAFLKEGIERLTNLSVSKSEITIWKFYHAMACNRLYSSYRQCRDAETKSKSTKLTNDSCRSFLEVVIDLPEDINGYAFYRASSYAYIADILISRMENSHDGIQIDIRSIENGKVEFEAMQKDPKQGFINAVRIYPNDEIILHRYGEALLMLSKRTYNKHDKLCMLEKAKDVLTTAIDLQQKTHLAVYKARNNVYISMFDCLKISEDEEKCKKLLLNARKDGLLLMKEHFVTSDYCDLATVCQYLAKFPQCNDFGEQFVKDVEYINEALDHVNTSLHLKGQTFAIANIFGSILFDLGEYETAAAWATRALLLTKIQNPTNITNICWYMLQEKPAYRDIFNILTYVVRKYDNIGLISKALTSGLVKYHFTKLCGIITYLQNTLLDQPQTRIAKALIESIDKKKPPYAQLGPATQRYTFRRSQDVPLVYTQADIAKVIKEREQCTNENVERLQVPTSLEYDFSAITGKDDVGWIKSFVFNQLSLKLFDDDVALKGRPLCEDHDLYSSIILDALDAVHTSRSTLMFLSDSFLEREWPLLKTPMLDMLKKRPDFLILCVLDSCQIPTELEQLSTINLANDKQIPIEIDNLKLKLFTSQYL